MSGDLRWLALRLPPLAAILALAFWMPGLEGVVRHANGTPAAGATVFRTYFPQHSEWTVADAHGRFSFGAGLRLGAVAPERWPAGLNRAVIHLVPQAGPFEMKGMGLELDEDPAPGLQLVLRGRAGSRPPAPPNCWRLGGAACSHLEQVVRHACRMECAEPLVDGAAALGHCMAGCAALQILDWDPTQDVPALGR